jgi:hypothetical protein
VVDLRIGVADLKGFDAGPASDDLEAARYHDEAASQELDTVTAVVQGKRDRAKAAAKVEEALRLENAAIEFLNQALAPPPPTSSTLGDCVFESAQNLETVKVSWPGEGGASVLVVFGGSAQTPQTKTAILNGTGIGYVGPFTVGPGATYPIIIKASDPTTGATAQATAAGGIGPTTTVGSDCSIGH